MATMFFVQLGWNEESYSYRGHSRYASCKSLLHLAQQFQRRRFSESTNQKQELSMAAMFVNWSGRNEYYLGPSIDASF